jgi:hypothetical protein
VVSSSSFRDALRDITGDSWLDDLARASLTAADAKFSPDHVPPPVLRVALVGIRDMEAHDSYLITKAVQDATAKLGHIIRDPRSERSMAHPADRAKALLIQRGQAGNILLFGFPPILDESTTESIPLGRVETLGVRAARELVSVLPSSAEDDAALDAVLAQRLTVRNAVNDIVNAVPRKASGIGLQLTPSAGDAVSSVLSAEQAHVLKESLRETRVDRRIITMAGRLDGVRTRRRIFYLEPDSGGEIHGAMDLELLDEIRANLDHHVVVRLQEEHTQSLSGRRSQPLYRLIRIQPDSAEMF